MKWILVNKPNIQAVDLFCGVGGLTHGLTRGGIRVKAGVDSDADCRFAFESNNRAEFICKDVRHLTADEVRAQFQPHALTLLAGCAPCQPFSTYSQSSRKNRENSDWCLLEEFGRLVQSIEPDLVTMENVPSMAGHPVFESFLRKLDDYHVAWRIVECASVGIPQTRRRLVLLASRLGSAGLEFDWNVAMPATVRDAIFDLPALRAGEGDPRDGMHLACKLSDLNLRRIRASRPGGSWRDWPEELRATCHRKSSGDTYPSVYGRMEWDRPAPTMTTQCFGYGNGRFGHPDQDRAITLREAALLQTFPKDYKFLRSGERAKFSKLGRLIGNAVPVKLGQLIGETLVKHVSNVGCARAA